MTNNPKWNYFFSNALQPLRIISLLLLLTNPFVQIHWKSAEIIFYGFFLLFLSSFVVEIIFHPEGMRKGIREIYTKYTQMIALEFVAIASFAILSFSTDHHAAFMWELGIFAIVSIFGAAIEIIHKRVMPRLKQIRIDDRIGMVIFVGIITLLVFVWIHIFNTSIEKSGLLGF